MRIASVSLQVIYRYYFAQCRSIIENYFIFLKAEIVEILQISGWGAKKLYHVLLMFYNNKFGNVSVTYIRKRVEVKWCFDVINYCFDDRKMQYIRCVINTTEWYPKFSTEDILHQTWKKKRYNLVSCSILLSSYN